MSSCNGLKGGSVRPVSVSSNSSGFISSCSVISHRSYNNVSRVRGGSPRILTVRQAPANTISRLREGRLLYFSRLLRLERRVYVGAGLSSGFLSGTMVKSLSQRPPDSLTALGRHLKSNGGRLVRQRFSAVLEVARGCSVR